MMSFQLQNEKIIYGKLKVENMSSKQFFKKKRITLTLSQCQWRVCLI